MAKKPEADPMTPEQTTIERCELSLTGRWCLTHHCYAETCVKRHAEARVKAKRRFVPTTDPAAKEQP